MFCFSSGFVVVYVVDVFRLPGKPFTRIFIYPDVDSTKQECKCFHTKDSMTIPKIKVVIGFYIFKGYGDKLYTRFAFFCQYLDIYNAASISKTYLPFYLFMYL